MRRLSIIVPVLNDAAALRRLLAELDQVIDAATTEVFVVDGGSTDQPGAALIPAARLLESPVAGRGAQLAAGVKSARGEYLWLLHADSRDVGAALAYLLDIDVPCWGRFDVRLDDDSRSTGWPLRMVAWSMNRRSRMTGICTGDQGIFVHRALLERIGGIPAQPLMEDIELSRRLKRLCAPCCPRITLSTSGRRWLNAGVIRTILSMWRFRLRYWLGADPETLARAYYHAD